MSKMNPKPRSLAFKVGWGILLFFSIGNVLGHIGLSIFESQPTTVFVAWAGFNFLAAGILLIPYRRGEKWAWFIVWALGPGLSVAGVSPAVMILWGGSGEMVAAGMAELPAWLAGCSGSSVVGGQWVCRSGA